MTLGKLFADGQEIRIDKRIGKGGEGEVYSLSNLTGYAVKAYLPAVVRERESKIRAMVSTKLANDAPMVAFPYQVVVDAKGQFVGFMMRLVEKHKEIHELQTPSSRQKHFPKADYRFLVRVAVNIARVFAQVHSTGCVVGDINQRGILVSSNATVALIDADSFQVTYNGNRYLCAVGVPEYTPPELQGKSLKSVIRTPDHDAFGLAVCLFQLLCMDRHPFSGRYQGAGEMPLEKAISEFRFAYSTRNTGMTPPPGTVRLQDFTPKVQQLFESAFSSQYLGKRPSAVDWVAALGELEASLRVCSKNRLHHYSRTASECPWCRMEGEYGRPLFFDVDLASVSLPSGKIDDNIGLSLDLPALLAAINTVHIPATISVSVPPRNRLPPPSQIAVDVKSRQQMAPLVKFAGYGAIAIAIYVFLAGYVPFLLAAGFGAVGVWLLAKDLAGGSELTSRYESQLAKVTARVEHLQRNSPVEAVVRTKAEALNAIDEYKALTDKYGNIKAEYDKARRQQQLDNYLSRYLIRGGKIPKLSSADIASLSSYGISTALDATRRDPQQVYGIGPVKGSNIAAWVSRLTTRFHFHVPYTQEDKANIRKAQSELISKQQGLDDKIKKRIDELRTKARAFEHWKNVNDPELAELCAGLAQCEADLHHAGFPIPAMPNIRPAAVPSAASFQRTARPVGSVLGTGGAKHGAAQVGNPNCPSCNSRMVRRVARRGRRAGKAFWGCSRYPSCTGTRPI